MNEDKIENMHEYKSTQTWAKMVKEALKDPKMKCEVDYNELRVNELGYIYPNVLGTGVLGTNPCKETPMWADWDDTWKLTSSTEYEPPTNKISDNIESRKCIINPPWKLTCSTEYEHPTNNIEAMECIATIENDLDTLIDTVDVNQENIDKLSAEINLLSEKLYTSLGSIEYLSDRVKELERTKLTKPSECKELEEAEAYINDYQQSRRILAEQKWARKQRVKSKLERLERANVAKTKRFSYAPFGYLIATIVCIVGIIALVF